LRTKRQKKTAKQHNSNSKVSISDGVNNRVK
jgi:hypothetical protein